MTKEDFVRMVEDRLPDYFSEDIKITDISVKEVVKHNDQHKLGIEFTFADNNFSPVIYPDTLLKIITLGNLWKKSCRLSLAL